jgi:hypothetical protein
MKRLIFVTLAFLVGCNGMGSSGNRFLPSGPAGTDAVGANAAGNGFGARPIGDARRRKAKVRLKLTVPHRRHHARALAHPSTISSATQSVGISINGGAAQVFNTTPTSPGCVIGPSGTTCTFTVNAAIGSDTLAVTTYSATGGGGTALDRGSAVVSIVAGKANMPSITLGPVVSTTANTGIGSLRYAIGAANNGDTIMFLLPAGSVVALTSPITVTGNVSVAGPGVTASLRHGGRVQHATYSGVTLSGGNAQQIFVINAGATMTLSGLILTAGKAAVAHQPGGAIYNQGTLSLVGDTFTGNSSIVSTVVRAHPAHVHQFKPAKNGRHSPPQNPEVLHPHACSDTYYEGGAVYNNGTLNVTGSTFDGNVAASNFFPAPLGSTNCEYGYGGAIYNDQYGILTSSGNLYTNNQAYDGGAVYNYSRYGQATFTSDTFTSNSGCTATSGCPTLGCTGTGCTSYAYGYGAAISDEYGPGITITGSVFSGNVVGNSANGFGEGGALYLDSGNPSITGSTFTNNQAGGGTTDCSAGEGGAIAAYYPLALNNDTFTGNQAGGDENGYGGAIYADGSGHQVIGSNDTFASNTASGTGSTCHADGDAYGGAVYAYYGAQLSNSSFQSNVSTSAYAAYGGAVYVEDPSKFANDTFASNTAVGKGTGPVNSYGYGGALYAAGDTTLSNSSFTGNVAEALGTQAHQAYGGAIYNDSTLGSTKDTFTSNSASETGSASADAYGGAVYTDSSFISNGDSYQSNAVTSAGTGYGGAIENDSAMAVTGGTFTSNSTTSSGNDSEGGAIYNDGTPATITNATLNSNSATATGGHFAAGGGIYDASGIVVSGSTIASNSALNEGGGLFLDSGTETLANDKIASNQVTSADGYGGGGGIYGNNGFTLTNSTVSGNGVTISGSIAHSGGGGIYNNAGMTITASTISGNAVAGASSGTNDGGGGIYNYDDATVQNSTVTGNSSSFSGGGIEIYDPTLSYHVNLINVTVFGNAATSLGGNVDDAYRITNLTNAVVGGGSAATGPDVANAGTITSGGYNIVATAFNPAGTYNGTTTGNVTADPLLLALANNGGPTFTDADTSSSPGKGHIPFAASACGSGGMGSNVDQRGFARGAGGVCDSGAFEFGGTPSLVHRYVPPVHTDLNKPKRHTPHRHPRPAP